MKGKVQQEGRGESFTKLPRQKKNPISHFLIPVNSSQRADRDLFVVICCSLSTPFTFYQLSADGLADMLLLE